LFAGSPNFGPPNNDAHRNPGGQVGVGDIFQEFAAQGQGTNGTFELQRLYAFEISASALATAVPEPASLSLLAVGLAGIAGYAWRKRRPPVA
jgi:hypothetical protein